ncbi:mCG7243 [Mus musculus]|nr:mCG7243 [Mus musculus]
MDASHKLHCETRALRADATGPRVSEGDPSTNRTAKFHRFALGYYRKLFV